MNLQFFLIKNITNINYEFIYLFLLNIYHIILLNLI